MRSRTLLSILPILFVACSSSPSTTKQDSAVKKYEAGTKSDGSMTVTPYNMPQTVFCWTTPACSTTGSTPICCDQKGADGGYSDTCIASASTCTGNAYQCGQAADCGSGMVCCGSFGTSGSGKMYFKGTTCATSCATGQTQLCVSASECKTGTSCVGEKISDRDVGLCQ